MLKELSRCRQYVESNKMEWSQDKTIDFLVEYRKLDVLWDVRLEDYKNNRIKLIAQKQLASKFDCDVATVKRKIKNLRTAFRREHKNLTTVSLNVPKKSVKWFAYDDMSFLLDVDIPKRNHSTVEGSDAKGMQLCNENGMSRIIEQDGKGEDFTKESLEVSPPHTPGSSQGEVNVSDTQSDISVSSKRSRLPCPRCEMPQEKQLATCTDPEDTQKNMRSKFEDYFYTSDRFDHLAKNWAGKLRTINPTQRIYVEKLINDVFYEAELCTLSRISKVLVGESQFSHPDTKPFINTTPGVFSEQYQHSNGLEEPLEDQITDVNFMTVKEEILTSEEYY